MLLRPRHDMGILGVIPKLLRAGRGRRVNTVDIGARNLLLLDHHRSREEGKENQRIISRERMISRGGGARRVIMNRGDGGVLTRALGEVVGRGGRRCHLRLSLFPLGMELGLVLDLVRGRFLLVMLRGRVVLLRAGVGILVGIAGGMVGEMGVGGEAVRRI